MRWGSNSLAFRACFLRLCSGKLTTQSAQLLSSGDPDEERLSRRRFLKWVGGLAVVGGVGVGLDGATGGLSGHDSQKATSIKPAAQVTRGERAGTETVAAAFADRQNSAQTPPAPGGFSIFWMTDTQFLSETNPGLFRRMNRWILNNWAAYNGKVVIHTGDLVQDGSVPEQWEKAGEAMNMFLQNGIPYTWCAGNHDDLVLGNQFSGWIGNEAGAPALDPETVSSHLNRNNYPAGTETACSQAAAGYAQWIGDFNNGMDTALRFTANGLNFLVINLE